MSGKGWQTASVSSLALLQLGSHSTTWINSLLARPPAISLLLNPKPLSHVTWKYPSSRLPTPLSWRNLSLSFYHLNCFFVSLGSSYPVSVRAQSPFPLPPTTCRDALPSETFMAISLMATPRPYLLNSRLPCQLSPGRVYLAYSTDNSKREAYGWVGKSSFDTAFGVSFIWSWTYLYKLYKYICVKKHVEG